MTDSKRNIQLLIDGSCKGNTSAQRKLFELYYGYVLSICRLYGTTKEQQEEMLNDSFYNMFRYLDSYKSQYPFKPWLRKLCVNACLKYLKKNKFKLNIEELQPYHEIKIQDEQLDELDDSQYLKFVQQLSVAYRTVFILYVFEEYSHKEIAAKLDISVGTSKSNLNRAKQRLKEMIAQTKKNSKKDAYG